MHELRQQSGACAAMESRPGSRGCAEHIAVSPTRGGHADSDDSRIETLDDELRAAETQKARLRDGAERQDGECSPHGARHGEQSWTRRSPKEAVYVVRLEVDLALMGSV